MNILILTEQDQVIIITDLPKKRISQKLLESILNLKYDKYFELKTGMETASELSITYSENYKKITFVKYEQMITEGIKGLEKIKIELENEQV